MALKSQFLKTLLAAHFLICILLLFQASVQLDFTNSTMYAEDNSSDDTLFRKAFKRYKNNFDSIDVTSELVDLKNGTCLSDWTRLYCNSDHDFCNDSNGLHLNNPIDWIVYKFNSRPGLILASNVFNDDGHFYWPQRCLTKYIAPPNKSNVTSQLTLNTFDDIMNNPILLKKMRWLTLGYHHDWDTKVYSEERRSSIPDELSTLSFALAKILLDTNDFRAEACIVNFYPPNSTLAGHVDQSERNFSRPLISISFGQPAVFLVGGKNQNVRPTAIMLRSGDVVLMYDEMRLAYHAVPKVLRNGFTLNLDSLKISPGNNSESDLIIDYINKHRININLRQVNPD